MRLLLCEDSLSPGAEMELSSPGGARFIYCHDGDCQIKTIGHDFDAGVPPIVLSPGKAHFISGVTHIQAGIAGAALIKWEFVPRDVEGETWSQGVATRLLCEQILMPASGDYSSVTLNLLLVDALENIILGEKASENIYLLLKGAGEIPSFANMDGDMNPSSIEVGQAWAQPKGKKHGFKNKAPHPAWLLELQISEGDADAPPSIATEKFIRHSLSSGLILQE